MQPDSPLLCSSNPMLSLQNASHRAGPTEQIYMLRKAVCQILINHIINPIDMPAFQLNIGSTGTQNVYQISGSSFVRNCE
jgi:hypothetical protein